MPGNPARGLDAHQGVVILSDGETGEVRAVVNASAITAIRTAAVSAVATRLLAREGARELAVLGAGVQARSHLAAMAVARDFEVARIWSRTPEHAEAVAAEAGVPFPVEVAPSAEDAVANADVVCTTTSAPEPIVRREWLRDGRPRQRGRLQHPDHPRAGHCHDGRRLPLRRPPRVDASTRLATSSSPSRKGAIGPEHIRAELGELLAGRAQGRTSDDELTVFKSLGLAVEDLAAAEHVYRRARETGTGTEVDL